MSILFKKKHFCNRINEKKNKQQQNKQTNKTQNKQIKTTSQIHGEFPYIFIPIVLHTPQNVWGRGNSMIIQFICKKKI